MNLNNLGWFLIGCLWGFCISNIINFNAIVSILWLVTFGLWLLVFYFNLKNVIR